MAKNDLDRELAKLRVPAKGKFDLGRRDTDDECGLKDKARAEALLLREQVKLQELQGRLYADGRWALLVVLQAMDTGGKDGTIRRVFGPLNPAGVRVTAFKQPSDEELAHDYLWRIHGKAPRRGMIRIFNRSHYEDVLVVRVHKLVPAGELERRYEQINAFERHLADNRTVVLKLFLHISKHEQKQRLQERLDDPEKHWKFAAGDLKERALWRDYQKAYELALGRCSTPWAPWYVIPADKKWVRNVMIARLVRRTLERLDLRYPKPEPGLAKIRITD